MLISSMSWASLKNWCRSIHLKKSYGSIILYGNFALLMPLCVHFLPDLFSNLYQKCISVMTWTMSKIGTNPIFKTECNVP